MRGKITFFLDEMREGTDAEKMKSCRRLRRFLRTAVGVNPADETTVVLAALRETGYDPDRSQARAGRLPDRPGHPRRARRRVPLGKLRVVGAVPAGAHVRRHLVRARVARAAHRRRRSPSTTASAARARARTSIPAPSPSCSSSQPSWEPPAGRVGHVGVVPRHRHARRAGAAGARAGLGDLRRRGDAPHHAHRSVRPVRRRASARAAPAAVTCGAQRSATPISASSSASAASGSSTLIVVMPSARAVFRLLPMSSRNTASGGRHAELAAGELVDARVGLAQPDHRRLDEDVEERAQQARCRRPR